MEVLNLLNNLKAKILAIKSHNNNMAAYKRFEKEAEQINDRSKCRGELESSKKEFNRIILKQIKEINEGEERYNIQENETMLQDAALGYWLVTDAIFALKSRDYNGIEKAYSLLDAATARMQGKKDKSSKSSYEKGKYIVEQKDIDEKEERIKVFYQKLLDNKDIELCIRESQPIYKHEADIMNETRKNGDRIVSEKDEIDSDGLDNVYQSAMKAMTKNEKSGANVRKAVISAEPPKKKE